MRNPKDSLNDTVWKDIPALDAGFDLDGLRFNGYFTVVDPANSGAQLPSGAYFLRSLVANVTGSRRSVQEATNVLTGSEYFRARGTSGWSTWTLRSAGGEGASDAINVSYDDGADAFGTGTSTTVAEVLDEISYVFGSIPTQASTLFDIRDYGGVGDGTYDNRAAFLAASTAISNAGGGVLYVPRGVWGIGPTATPSLGGVILPSNTVLRGDGIGVTTIKALDLGNTDLTGIVRTQSGVETSNVMVRDITIDGNKAGQSGYANIINFYCGVTPDNRVLMDRNIFVINVESKNARSGTDGSSNPGRGYGIDPHEVVDNFVMMNCTVHDCDRDGVIHDGIINFKNVNNRSYNNGRHGFNYVKESFNGLVLGNHSHDNGANGILIQQDSHHLRVIGNLVEDNGEQGIRVRRGETVVNTLHIISNNTIKGSGRSGINITGACYNEVSNNLIQDSSQAENNTYFDINMQGDDGDGPTVTAPKFNVVRNNSGYSLGATIANASIREDTSVVTDHENTYLWNIAAGQTNGKYKDITATSIVKDLGISDIYNVKEWGARGDGTTDDGAILRSCVAFAESAGGGVVYLPPGVYAASGTGIASQGVVSLPSNVALIGAGKNLSKILAIDPVDDSITGIVRTRSGASNLNVLVRGLSVEASAPSGTGGITCVYIGGYYSAKINLEDLGVYYAVNGTANIGYGIRLTNTTEYCYLSGVTVEGCENAGIYVDGAQRTTIVEPAVSTCAEGIHVSNGALYTRIVEPSVDNAGTNGILVNEDSYYVTVSGGIVELSGEDGIRIRRGASVQDTLVSITGVTLRENGRDGISIAGARRNDIIGCTLKDNGANINSTYNDVSLETDSAHGGSADLNNILSCLMIASGTNSTAYGVREYVGQADGNSIQYNVFSGQTTGKVLISGGITLYADESQYLLLAGRSGGQNLVGGTGGGDNLTLSSTTNAVKGRVLAFASEFTLRDNNDTNRKARFDAASLTSGLERVYVLPNQSGTVALLESKGSIPEGLWVPNSGSTTVSNSGLLTSTTGTATARTAANTNLNTASRRLGYQSAGTAGNSAGVRQSSRNIWIGNSAGLGGFNAQAKFALAGSLAATQRGFIGLSADSAFVVDAASPGLLSSIDLFGLGFDDGDSSLSIFHNDNVGTPTKIGLGANFPVAVDAVYVVSLACTANGSSISYVVERVNTAHVASGTVSSELPRNNVFMALQAATHNGSTASAVDIDVHLLYYRI